ncbi:ParM/StbA family protein [Parageobacillus thermoglucosidasius]|uniref:ParM/StbA family protein n=1 Tax=Parageobacillus thermoglucosidasius TaxID=1426 RepID=A0AB38R4N7_PARTM|nr:ParM/StbA family protein [Parageobacillus thermoglucosidasius]UOE78390.1 ParM/StbA family protein [Parageobacillus thermoglucosidasius]
MVTKLYAEDILITGIDAGNTSLKISFLDETGNIKDFAIPTVIAPAPNTAIEMKDHKAFDIDPEELLHVRVKTEALDGEEKDAAWYVGLYAQNKKGVRQPKVNDGKAEQKFSDSNKAIFVIPTLASIAVAAIKADKKKVKVPLSIGETVESYKKRKDKLMDLFFGKHEVVFLDGPFKGQEVEIEITDVEIEVESVTTSLAIEFTIKNGECVETEIGKKIGQNYALADLGAGTTDVAVFTEKGVEKSKTHGTNIGTNAYIDQIIREIAEKEEFKAVRQQLLKNGRSEEEAVPFLSREKFVNEIIKPEIEKVLDKPEQSYKPTYRVSWGWVKNVDVTDIVEKYLKKYAEDQKNSLLLTYAELDVNNFLLVGGGVLFGYEHGLKELAGEQYGMIFPSLKESQFFTSRSFLIANYLRQLEKHVINA